MFTTWSKYNWLNNNRSRNRSLVTFVASVGLLGLFLMIPVNLYFKQNAQQHTLEVELTKDIPKPIETPKKPVVAKPKPTKVKEIVKTKVEPKKISKKKLKPVKKAVVSTQIISKEPKAITKKTLPSSSVILSSTKLLSDYKELDKDFMAPTGEEQDFKFKVYEQPSWNQVTKLLDEEVDKPQYEMNFYSEGIMGATERFFDKISYKKTFTTRYGTKIYCGGIGPLAICSWK